MGQSNSHPHPQHAQFLAGGPMSMTMVSPTTSHHQWAQSFPRPGRGGGPPGGMGPGPSSRHPEPHVKVLPERLPPLKLRTTDNGAILHNGGTISGRKQGFEETLQIRPRSSSAHRPSSASRHHHSSESTNLERSSRCGSEPDLRQHHHRDSSDSNATSANHGDHGNRHRISRSRKKYKAPNAPIHSHHHNHNHNHGPVHSTVESSSPELPGWDNEIPRKVRLFKTRAETTTTPHRKQSQQPEEMKPVVVYPAHHRPLHRSRSHEVISTGSGFAGGDFRAELLETAQKLRPRSAMQEFSKSPDNRSHSVDRSKSSSTTTIIAVNDNTKSQTLPNNNTNKIVDTKDNIVNSQPKTFYFGMEESNKIKKEPVNNNVNKTNREHRLTAVERSKNMMNLKRGPSLLAQQRPTAKVPDKEQDEEDHVEKFAANYHQRNHHRNTSSCSSSFISDPDDPQNLDGGIALQLRPTLPKKQLEIPRFSPTAAWRLLSTIDMLNCSSEETVLATSSSRSHSHSQGSTMADSEAGSGGLAFEERIHHGPLLEHHRPLRHHRPSRHDKSADSGISGDTSPAEMPANNLQPAEESNKPIIVAWTPQQDLEETSSDDLEPKIATRTTTGTGTIVPGAKLITRGPLHAFSMSLPRDERLCVYPDENKVKNAIDISAKFESLGSQDTDGNWLLSRSVPSSLTNGHNVLSRSASSPSTPDQEDDSKLYQNSKNASKYSYLSRGGHLMYLPEYQARCSPDVGNMRRSSSGSSPYLQLSKSCENISAEMRQLDRSPSPVRVKRPEVVHSNTEHRGGKKKKFTFQSTVRMIENKRLAERLSREAELKESQRLSELEAMKKVEEEFQKKRAREKANIRHQLRLFSLEEKQYSSLPPMDWIVQDANNLDANENSTDGRSEPDGAPASLQFNGKSMIPSQQAHTQILSEFRETTRDYREYRQPRRVESPEVTVTPNAVVSENGRKSTSIVEHPPFVYDMPKNLPVYVSKPKSETSTRSTPSNNYRKNFAHGSSNFQGNTDSDQSRTTSRQNGRRSRSATPDTQTNEEDNNQTKDNVNCTSLPRIQLTTVQPFSKSSSTYRPIAFNPNKFAQAVSS